MKKTRAMPESSAPVSGEPPVTPRLKSDRVWRPFTHMSRPEVVEVERGEGAALFTPEGRRIVDGISSWWVTNHGHAHPYIAEAVGAQARKLEQVIFAGTTHPQAERLAERICALRPDHFDKVFFSDDGSTAVEVALKMMFQYFRNRGETRTEVVALKGGYHGDTFGAMAVSGRGIFNRAFEPLLFGAHYLDLPTEENLPEVRAAFAKLLEREQVAGLILEPLVLGAGGMKTYPPESLAALIEDAQAAGRVVIADEVMTGFGRTGRMLATDAAAPKPDMVCFSKGLTGGFLPMSLTVCNRRIFEAFLSEDRSKDLFHGHSFTANPIACAAANASLDLFEKEEVWQNISRISEKHAAFADELSGLDGAEAPRTCGPILAFELAAHDEGYLSALAPAVRNFCISRGALLRPLGNTLYVMPPYCIEDADLDFLYQTIRDGLRDGWR